jgi:hypothetical protein
MGAREADHAVVWMVQKNEKKDDATQPPPLLKGEGPLRAQPIKIIAASNHDTLHPASRLNYARAYTIEHDAEVSFIGEIDKKYFARFMSTWKRVLTEYEDDGDMVVEEEILRATPLEHDTPRSEMSYEADSARWE